MSRNSPFIVTRLVMQGTENIGERLPILLERESRMPVRSAMEWALTVRRGKPVAANTLERELRHIGHFFAWLLKEGLSFRDPMSFVDSFTPNRIDASLRPWLGKDNSDRKVKKLSVGPSVIGDRIAVIADYIDWVLRNYERSMSVRSQAKQILAFRAAREGITKSLGDILPTQNDVYEVEGLPPSEVTRLIQFIDPDNPKNPWARGSSKRAIAIRQRNQLIVLLMLAFGPSLVIVQCSPNHLTVAALRL